MVVIYFFDDSQKLMKIEKNPLSVIQTQELNDTGLLKDSLSVSLSNDERLLDAQYMAVKSHEGNAQAFDMYRIVDSQTSGAVTYFTGIQLAYYELAGYVVEDLRPTDRTVGYIAEQLLADTEWRVGYVDDLPPVTTNFFYSSVKDSFSKLQSIAQCEIVFKVELSGQGITDKWVEIYSQLGDVTRKRFTYGDSALDVVREMGHNDIYTALIGRGKGEESGDGFSRKITFEEIEWSLANDHPVDKPLGQNYVELPEMTAMYGVPVAGGKRPRIGVVEFDTEDALEVLELTHQTLVHSARPKVLFTASVMNIGNTNIGDTVTIHRYGLGIHYETRIRKVERNKLNDNRTIVQLGDVTHESSTTKTTSIVKDVANQMDELRDEINYVGETANGKNSVTWGNDEPLQARTGDLWYRNHPVTPDIRQRLIFDGNAFIIPPYDAGNMNGTMSGEDVTLTNLTADSLVSGTLDLALGLQIGNGLNPILSVDATTNEVVMNVDSLMIKSFDPEADSVHEDDLVGYLRYSNGIVEIGEEGAEVLTQFSNDQWAMIRNQEKVMWLEKDIINIQKANFFQQMQVGNFAFIPRANGSLDFKKVVD